MAKQPAKKSGPAAFAGKQVVVDTHSRFVYIGQFVEVTRDFVILANADAHDMADSPAGTTKERYVRETKQFGIKDNRRQVHIFRDKVAAISLLSDVAEL